MDSPPRGLAPATREMAEALAGRVCAEHAREVRETTGMTAREATLFSFEASVEAYAFLDRTTRRPVLMMGVARKDDAGDGAMVWMLGADGMAEYGAGVLRAARWGLGRAFAATGAGRLRQSIPAWYETGLRFALRLGFVLSPAGQRDGEGVRFWNITLHKEDAILTRRLGHGIAGHGHHSHCTGRVRRQGDGEKTTGGK